MALGNTGRNLSGQERNYLIALKGPPLPVEGNGRQTPTVPVRPRRQGSTKPLPYLITLLMDAILGKGRAGIRLTATGMRLGKERVNLGDDPRKSYDPSEKDSWRPLAALTPAVPRTAHSMKRHTSSATGDKRSCPQNHISSFRHKLVQPSNLLG